MGLDYKNKILKDLIVYIPSKDLQDEYYKDIREGNEISFTDRELYNIINKVVPDKENLAKLRFLYKIYRETDDRFLLIDIKDNISKLDIKNLIKEKNIKEKDNIWLYMTRNARHPSSFVNYKTLFRYGDIIKCKYKGVYRYGIVDNYDYENVERVKEKHSHIRYEENVYVCFLLNNVDDYSIKRFLAHKDSTESCTYEELPCAQKDALFKIIRKAQLYDIDKKQLIKKVNLDEYLKWCLDQLTNKYTKHVSTFSNGYIHELSDKLWCLCGGARKSFLYDIVYDYLNKNFKLYGIYPKDDWRNDWIRH